MTSIYDVEKDGRCVEADRVPCTKARNYLKKKGLICGTKPPRPKPTPAREVPGFLDRFINSKVDRKVSQLQNRIVDRLDVLVKEWLDTPHHK